MQIVTELKTLFMKNQFFALTFILSISISNAQIWKEAQKTLEKNLPGSTLSEQDAAKGIKEALTQGISNGVETVSIEDGYFKNSEIKIPFPEDAKIIENKLRAIGLDSKVDKVVLSINRAAEDAAVEAKPIFVSAIKSMTISDAINIVRGEDNAATLYLEDNTYSDLVKVFKPIIENSLQKVNATKYWNDVVVSYNKIPLVKKMNPDLSEYVTEKAIDGLFVMIAKEELKIRTNPLARTTEILRKVFK